jgi:endonuclease VIII
VETPHPRAAALQLVPRLDRRRLERVQAVGKNLLLDFEGGLVLRSHLRMRGRWRVLDAGMRLELTRGRSPAVARLGPDVLASPPDLDAMVAGFRAADQARAVGDALLDQRLVAGIGNMWRAEALFAARISPWRTLGELTDDDLRGLLSEAARLMRAGRGRRQVYRRAGLPCRRCGTAIGSAPQGDAVRTAYWCPGCQRQAGTSMAGA